jgi:hypothetical protein
MLHAILNSHLPKLLKTFLSESAINKSLFPNFEAVKKSPHMKFFNLSIITILFVIMSCTNTSPEVMENTDNQGKETEFKWQTEQFKDIRILRYQVPGWEKLDLRQKKLAYYLTQAGLAGRDILWDQYYRHNLEIRKALEGILASYEGDRDSEDCRISLPIPRGCSLRTASTIIIVIPSFDQTSTKNISKAFWQLQT